jgi:hypothetical protein
VLAGLAEARKMLDGLGERLAVRLGPEHEAVKQFRAANGALMALQRRTRLAPDPRHPHPEIQVVWAAFEEARAGFLAVAARTAGAQLP